MVTQTVKTQVWDNPDLMRHIYSFGDPSHRKFTHNLRMDLKAYPTLFAERYQERKLKDICSYTLNEYLYEFTTAKIEYYLQQYKRCFCCSRHNTDKPIWIRRQGMNKAHVIHPKPSVFENQIYDCDCCCRSLTRNFIRNIQSR